MAAYYNEIDPYAARWLRNLIAAGHIAPGDVDERSIEDVRPDDLRGYRQCHFFAGIGVWSYALRAAGWADDTPVWTGSCPCQPFSAAGKGAGFDDARHLWPVWRELITECGPAVVFGEQVSSKDAEPWLDLVQTDMEALGFAFGALAFPSAGVGAPHIRDRTYFVAHAAQRGRRKERAHDRGLTSGNRAQGLAAGSLDGSVSRSLEYPSGSSLPGIARRWPVLGLENAGSAGRMADAANIGFDGRRSGETSDGRDAAWIEPERLRFAERIESAGPTNGPWRSADWLGCRDGKFRPVEPGTFPLADGASSRVGRLRAYGNAINAEAARTFIEAAVEALDEYDLI